MVVWFDNDETAYMQWIEANPQGFVANVDRAKNFSQYPMVHFSTHGLISSPKIGNFTTGAYTKFCSNDLNALEQFALTHYGRNLTHCSQCMQA